MLSMLLKCLLVKIKPEIKIVKVISGDTFTGACQVAGKKNENSTDLKSVDSNQLSGVQLMSPPCVVRVISTTSFKTDDIIDLTYAADGVHKDEEVQSCDDSGNVQAKEGRGSEDDIDDVDGGPEENSKAVPFEEDNTLPDIPQNQLMDPEVAEKYDKVWYGE